MYALYINLYNAYDTKKYNYNIITYYNQYIITDIKRNYILHETCYIKYKINNAPLVLISAEIMKKKKKNTSHATFSRKDPLLVVNAISYFRQRVELTHATTFIYLQPAFFALVCCVLLRIFSTVNNAFFRHGHRYNSHDEPR